MKIADLVVAVHQTLDDAEIRHAFGGALAFGYAATPRGTVDVDVNAFVPPDELPSVASALERLGLVAGEADPLAIAGVRFSAADLLYPVDVFPSLDPRYELIERRVVHMPFGRDRRLLPFLSAEDICVFKLSFGRPKDWVDLAAVAEAKPNIDVDYIEEQVVGLRGATMYPRVARFRRFLPLP